MVRNALLITSVSVVGFALGCSHNQKAEEAPTPQAAVKSTSAKPAPKPEAAPTPAPVAKNDEVKPAEDASIFFDFDSALIRDDARPVLQRLATDVKSDAKAQLRVEGHCDERGTTEYNLALGQQRAEAARKYLTSLGVPASRVTTTSWGSERPKDSGHDESAWSQNRRDDIKRQ